MSERDKFRGVQNSLGVNPTGIPNDETKFAFQKLWNAALAEYREGQQSEPAPIPPPDIFRPGEGGLLSVDADGWLNGVSRQYIPGGGIMAPICLVIHFTAGATGQSSIDSWKERGDGVCAHIVIERNGEIVQCRPFNRTCGHAGQSIWVDPKTGIKHRNVNSLSVGIEIANAGDAGGALNWARRQPGFASEMARHRNGGALKEWEKFPANQLASCFQVTAALMAEYAFHDITGHDCIAPARRSDPGPMFPMADFRKAFGFEGLPVVHRA